MDVFYEYFVSFKKLLLVELSMFVVIVLELRWILGFNKNVVVSIY